MSIIGYRITSFAIAGVLCLGLSREGAAQTADTVDAVRIETITVTVYRVREPATVPMAKSETKGQAPSKSAIWVPGFWNLQGDRDTGPRAGGSVPAHWGWSNAWWSWIPGHWTQGDNWIPSSL